MRDLIIVGAGGFSKEVAWLAQEIGKFKILGILDDKLAPGSQVAGIAVLGTIQKAQDYPNAEFIVAIGTPRTRQFVVNKLMSLGICKFANLIHPSVIKSHSATLGEGIIICAGVILTVEISIGNHTIVNLNSTIGHECTIGKFCTIAPLVAISGNVQLGDCVEVGTGACIRQGLSLAPGSMLGMGGVLTKSIPENQIFIGNPAAFFKTF
jgi:sugar O-acyltransferase (sialic acid O-acetyltransferase NeuD family)